MSGPDLNPMFRRSELLASLPARRVTTLLFAIEARTARIVDRSRTAWRDLLAEGQAVARHDGELAGHRFRELIAGVQQKGVIVARFIAVLELLREAVIEVVQAEEFSPLHVRAAYRLSPRSLHAKRC